MARPFGLRLVWRNFEQQRGSRLKREQTLSIAGRTGMFQYQRACPFGRFLKRFMLHMYWLG